MFKVHNMEATLVDSGGYELVEHIQRSTDYDDAVVKVLQELGAGTLQSNEWERDGDWSCTGDVCMSQRTPNSIMILSMLTTTLW